VSNPGINQASASGVA